MQATNGDQSHHQHLTGHPQQFYVGAPYDPNLFMATQQALLTGYQKTLYPSVIPTTQMSPYLLSTQAIFPPLTANLVPPPPPPTATPTAIRLASTMPEMDKAVHEEPIEAGSLNYRRNRSNTSMGDEKQYLRRHSVSWESMTDDEREMVQREKRKEEAFKTALCDAFKRSGVCPYGDACRFAHGENELRMPAQPRGKAHPKYKTQLCDKFSTYGQCPYGPRCQFIHKLKKGLPLMEYNRALAHGTISPARDDEITNPDDSEMSFSQTRVMRRRSAYDLSDSGYSGRYGQTSGNAARRNLANQVEGSEEENCPKSAKAVYPQMQVVNIEMATGQRKASARRSLPSVIDQTDYQVSMANGKMFAKPENIRTYGAMIRANEESVKKTAVPVQNVITKMELSFICEEDTITDGSHIQVPPSVPSNRPSTQNQQKDVNVASSSPWYEKIFGKKMTVIREESMNDESSLQHDMTTNGGASEEYIDEEVIPRISHNNENVNTQISNTNNNP